MRRPIFAAIGVFDGVHRGHQKMLNRLVGACAGSPLKPTPAVVTFSPDPKQFFRPKAPPDRLTTLAERRRLLDALGIRKIFVLRFDRRLSSLVPGAFVEKILVRKLRLRRVFVGYNFRFGKGRAGSAKMLKRLCERRGIPVEIFPPQRANHRRISATAIRDLLKKGNLARAGRLLGYPYILSGKVIRGRGLGHSLGFPTANIQTAPEKLLPPGVYTASLFLKGQLRAAAVNIGFAPTLPRFAGLPNILLKKGKSPQVEAHILRFKGNLAGKYIRLFLIKRLRGERKFANIRALARQIQQDTKQCALIKRKLSWRKGVGVR